MDERTLPSRVQASLCDYYGMEDTPNVDAFVAPSERESLLVHEHEDGIDVRLELPEAALRPKVRATLDVLCQVVEGVSHFIYVAERARRELPTTQLELELQAEVDKYVFFVHRLGSREFEQGRASRLFSRLFERVRYLDPKGTETGDRYRLANDLAARYTRRLDASFAKRGRFHEMRRALQTFYRAGQTEKIELARAA
jgi:hypothetical protein